MYADTVTRSMKICIDETARRREIQEAYNRANGITPASVKKAVRDVIEIGKKDTPKKERRRLTREEREKEIVSLTAEMKRAASRLEFERAAALRDKIKELRAQNEK